MNLIASSAPDSVLVEAVEEARAALLQEVSAQQVGDHLSWFSDEAGALTHVFASTHTGYVGWHWAVTVARAPDAERVSVNEIVLLPGDGAIVAPAWVPYKDRLQPGDMSPGDLLPVADDDARLVPTYLVGDGTVDDVSHDDRAQIKSVAADLGLGRLRTLSSEGRDLIAERWHEGSGGPDAPIARSAPDQCWSCGFLVRLAGPLSTMFGVCANGNANDDGRVVTYDHGCGAHSEVKLARTQRPVAIPDHVFDSYSQDLEHF